MTRSAASPLAAIPAEALPYRELFEGHPHPTWLFDRETLRVLVVNRAAVRQYGYTHEEFRGMTIEALWPEEDASRLRSRLASMPHGMEDIDLQRHRSRGGRVFPVRVSSHDLKIGDCWTQLVQAEDMTDELEAREDTATREALDQAFGGAAVGLATTTPDGVLEYANPALSEMLGYTAEELAGTRTSDIAHPADRTEMAEVISDLASGERSSSVVEHRALRKDGSDLWVQASVSALCEPDGEVRRLVAVIEDLTERKAAERRLSESARLLELAGTLARFGGWRVDLQEGIARWSDEVCAIHEVPPGARPTVEEALAYYPPHQRSILRERFEALVTRGTPYDLELEMDTAGGRRIWTRAVAVPVYDDDGEIVAVQGACQDITSLKEQSEAVERATDRLTRIVEGITEAFVALDHEWQFAFLNGEAERLLERPREELLGRVVWEAFPDVGGSAFLSRFEEAVREQRPVELEEHFPPLDAWLEVRAYPSEEGLSVFFRDVTEEREARAALRTSEERFRLVSRATTDVIWDWDAEADRLWWSEGMRTAFGFDPAPAAHDSSTWAERVHPDDRARVLAYIRTVIKGSADTYEGEYRFRRGDGTYAHVRDRGLVFRDEEGRTVRIIGGMTDITSQRELGDRLLQAQRMQSIGNLAGGIAHDLNNVLTPILMSMNLLEHHVEGDDALEMLASIQLSAERAAALVQQVLSFARGLESPRGPVDMAEVVEELRKVVSETFPASIELEVDLPPELPTIQGDPNQIHQVLFNLCLNARDAMPSGGRLRIGIEEIRVERGGPGRDGSDHGGRGRDGSDLGRPDHGGTDLGGPDRAGSGTRTLGDDGHQLRVEVEDTGTGMPRGVVDQIFDPFFTTKDAGGGRGLGLSIVATIMRGHGGSITVESQPGRGTRFDLHFPVVAPEESEAPSSAKRIAEIPAAEPGSGWILVVDDEPAVRSVARRTLTALGYRVRAAAEGESALETLAEMGHGNVAAVVTDLMMPGMDGSALIATLLERFPHLPIVAMSGLEPDARTAEAIEAGRVVFLPKPYTTDELTAALREAARNRS